MPPLRLIHSEALGFHGAAQQVAVPALERSAARVVRKRARRHFIIRAWHLDGLSSGQVVKRQVHGATAIVPRALRGVGHEDFSFGWRRVPEDFRNVPGPVGVVDQQAIAKRLQLLQHTQKRLRGRPLKKCPRLRIDGRAQKVVRRGVANVEMNGRIERRQLSKVRLAKIAGLLRRRCCQRLAPERLYRARGSDVVGVRRI